MCVQLRQLRLFNAAEDEAAPGDVSARLFAARRQLFLSHCWNDGNGWGDFKIKAARLCRFARSVLKAL